MAPRFERGYALVIGIGADLPGAVADAEGLREILVDPDRCAFEQAHVKVLTGSLATRENILYSLGDLAQLPGDSTVLVFLAGHSLEISGTHYLMPHGYDRTKLTETGLDVRLFAEKLDKINGGSLLVLLDTCHSQRIGDAALGRARVLPTSAIELFSKRRGRVVIGSSKPGEASLGGKPYSAFTTALIEALCGLGTDEKDKYVRVADIAMYTAARVPGLTKDQQHPVLDFGETDNFAVAYYSGGEAEPKELPPAIRVPTIEPYPGAWSGRILVGSDHIVSAGRDAFISTTGKVKIEIFKKLEKQKGGEEDLKEDAPEVLEKQDSRAAAEFQRLMLIPAQVPHDVLVDNVHFTLTGPLVLAPGTAYELRFWVHVEHERSTVLAIARELHGLRQSEMALKSEGPYPLQRGSRISVRVKIDGLKCFDSHKWVTWIGEIGNTAFVVEVPPGASEGTYPGTASIRLNGLQIARMSFLLCVGPPKLNVNEIPSQTTSYRSAFASYASEDRVEVLSRVQGMEAAYKGLDVFVDVIDLRSGQNWERELEKRISKSDVFYLFWCRHAVNSDWVEKEWRWALAAKGQDFIDPVPLEGPEVAPPPRELADKHFNDPLLAFIAAAGGVHSD